MSKKRIILISIISCCVLIILLGMFGVFQKSDKSAQKRDKQIRRDQPAGAKSVIIGNLQTEGWEVISKKIIGLTESGKAKLDTPKIRLSLARGESGESPIIVISASKGDIDMNPKSQKADLSESVEIAIDKDTKIKSQRLFCDINNKHAYTEDETEIIYKGIVVKGEGIDVDGIAETAIIKRNVKVKIAQGAKLLFFDEVDEEKSPKIKDTNKKANRSGISRKNTKNEITEITCDGELTFERATNKATLSDNVRIRRGTMVMRADKLEIVFDPKEKKPTQIVATGNVKVRDTNNMKASKPASQHERQLSERGLECARIIWQNDEKRAILYGSPSDSPNKPKGRAKIKEKGIEIASSAIELYPKGPEIVARKDGYLIASFDTKSNKKKEGKEAGADNRIQIEWSRGMEYKIDPESKLFRAFFNGDVKVKSNQVNLTTEKLEAIFDPKNHEIQKLEASRGIRPNEDRNFRNKLVLLPPKHRAQSKRPKTDRSNFLSLSSSNDSSVEVSCKGGITFANTEHKVVFDEDVKVKRGKSMMSSRRLELILDKGNKELRNMTASGDAEILDEKLKMKSQEIYFSQADNQIIGKGPGKIHLFLNGNKKSDKNETSKQTNDIDVTWDGDMIFNRKENIAKFYDNVLARSGQGDREISCEELHVVLDEKGEMKFVKALGNVHISDSNESIEGQGDEFVLNAQTQRIMLVGNPAKMSKEKYNVESKRIVQTGKDAFVFQGEGFFTMPLSKENKMGFGNFGTKTSAKSSSKAASKKINEIKAMWKDKMVVEGDKGEATLYKEVVTSYGLNELHSQSLYISFDKDAQGEISMPKKIVAEGNVSMIKYASDSKDEREIEGEGDKLTWDYESDLATLSGTPYAHLWQRGKRIIAEKFYFSNQAKRVRTSGRSFMSISNLSE